MPLLKPRFAAVLPGYGKAGAAATVTRAKVTRLHRTPSWMENQGETMQKAKELQADLQPYSSLAA